MIFSTIVAVLNAAGWIAYYYFSGGYFEGTETAEVRFQTIAIMIIASAIAGIVSAISKNLFDNVIYNTLHVLVSTAIVTAPFYTMLYFDLSFWGIVKGLVLWSLAYFSYLVFFPFYDLAGKDGVPWWGRCLLVAGIVLAVTLYPEGKMSDFVIGPGFMVGIPISLVTGIGYTFFDLD